MRCVLVVELVNTCWDCRQQQENDVDSVVRQSLCSATEQDDQLLQEHSVFIAIPFGNSPQRKQGVGPAVCALPVAHSAPLLDGGNRCSSRLSPVTTLNWLSNQGADITSGASEGRMRLLGTLNNDIKK